MFHPCARNEQLHSMLCTYIILFTTPQGNLSAWHVKTNIQCIENGQQLNLSYK